MKKFLIPFLVASQITSGAFASNDVSAQVKLNRLSRVLLGNQPTALEREEMKQAIAEGRGDELLETKINDYLNSDQHAYKMSVRLDELFRVRTGGTPILEGGPTTNSPYGPDPRFYRDNSLNYLFTEMAKKNLSWDELLTRKSYRAFNRPDSFSAFSDWGFLAGLVPDLKAINGVNSIDAIPANYSDILYKDIQFAENDPRIAGVITTNRFFMRYGNTGVNKNRRRAAAIFRVFLCDSMSAAVSSSAGMDDQVLDLMFPHGTGMTEDQIRASTGEALHGTQPDCMACHYKLDPMGKTLLTSQSVLSTRASNGRLTYKKANGSLVDVEAKGVAGLGKAITQQEEYKSCQVRHFWKWFVGDVELTKERESALVKKFDQVGRRTNDFVKVLIQEPEFFAMRIPLTESQLQARRVKAYFKKCQDCHKDQFYEDSPDFKIPDFTQWPIGGSKASMKEWTGKIASAMDLAHDGENPRMPPSISSWRTRFKEMQLIKTWIDQGAPDENGIDLMRSAEVTK